MPSRSSSSLLLQLFRRRCRRRRDGLGYVAILPLVRHCLSGVYQAGQRLEVVPAIGEKHPRYRQRSPYVLLYVEGEHQYLSLLSADWFFFSLSSGSMTLTSRGSPHICQVAILVYARWLYV
jgi:hypothetical protein